MNTYRRNILTRFAIVFVAMILCILLAVVKIYYTMAVEGDFWRRLGNQQSKMLEVDPHRGNILSSDGKLLATSVPSYTLFMDMKADGLKKELFDSCIGPLSDSLALVYNVPAVEVKRHLQKGYREGKRYYKVNTFNSKKLSYVELKRVKTFPLYNLNKNKSGLVENEQVGRKFPFGSTSMCSRTIGGLYAEKGKGGKCGLEQYYDSILSGKMGKAQEVYVGSRKHKMIVEDPIDGNDLMTTLDVSIMDITDNALRQTLERVEAVRGCAVVMEVASGQIKAMCNLKRTVDGTYVEGENYAVNSQTEPGSTFKIASAIVALENGVDTSRMVDTGNGIWEIYGHKMKDWNYNKGGYGKISLNRGIQVSSNIVIAKIIEEKYKNNPNDFIKALHKMGLNTPLDLELNGVAKPDIKDPNEKSWSKLTLPWMAHGYELKMPPINLLTFYNGLANNGRMISPYLVKGIYHNGDIVQDFEYERVINEKLCSQKTLDKVRQMMIDVVEKGTAKCVHSNDFLIAGKTGTAVQKYDGTRKHQLTFCGYFPADHPKYSAIVVVWYPMAPIYPSAGNISGEVFKNIAERVYAQSPLTRQYMSNINKLDKDTAHVFMPATKSGSAKDLMVSLDKLDVTYTKNGELTSGWCRSEASNSNVRLSNQKIAANRVPNVKGMGAKDAVYLMENQGVKVHLSGIGNVESQSVSPGTLVTKGMIVALNLK